MSLYERTSRPLLGFLDDINLDLDPDDQYCEVCPENKPVSDFPERPPTAACEHSVGSCRPCLERAIEVQTRSKTWNQISCPMCSERLVFTDIKEFGDPATFAKEACVGEDMSRRGSY